MHRIKALREMRKEMNYKQIYAIKKKAEERIKKACTYVDNSSGIYILLRESDGFRYAYIGQAKHLLERLVGHLNGYSQRIDISLKKRGFINEKDGGWTLNCLHCVESELDTKEQAYILKYADLGYQLYNVTSGSQGQGKHNLVEGKSPKGYREGVEYGYQKACKEIKHLFDLHLNYSVKKENKVTAKALEKLEQMLSQ